MYVHSEGGGILPTPGAMLGIKSRSSDTESWKAVVLLPINFFPPERKCTVILYTCEFDLFGVDFVK